jgi:NADH-quinone oxidoreductase subunit G
VSASPQAEEQALVHFEIDGVAVAAPKGSMIIQAADAAGIVIPRFCYHPELSIAANCRMCLVEVEKVPKPMPACATPVSEGMKVFTKSPRAVGAQRAVVEFLLVNHPLDCPVCDQGGECPLQEQAMGFGRGVSRFAEGKRAVTDKYLGPLVATAMTRCIHCTRCIRFLDEIGGVRELGAVGRGEHMEITNYLEHSLSSELSGNIIDVCPVGALLSKPYLNTARPWELTAVPSIAPHDGVGSHVELHVLRGQVMRVLPRANPDVNHIWLSDRDRFSYQGLYSADRLTRPMVKQDGAWREVGWDEALALAARRIVDVRERYGAAQMGALLAPTATLEELYLAQKLMAGLGSSHIDHRLRQGDFTDDDQSLPAPWLGQSLVALEHLGAALLVGSNVRKEQPLASYRLRRAALKGARIAALNPLDYESNFPLTEQLVAGPTEMLRELAAICRALLDLGAGPPWAGLEDLLQGVEAEPAHRSIAESLQQAERAAVLLGNAALAHPQLAALRFLAAAAAQLSGATLGYLPESANSVGAWLAGALPHRLAGGSGERTAGLNARAMLDARLKAYLLWGLEPELDCWDQATALQALEQAELVTAFSAYRSPALERCAHILLPVAIYAETSGTLVNGEGRWQSFRGAVPAPGEARPGWKILRVIGNLLNLHGFEHESSEQVRDELRALCPQDMEANAPAAGLLPPTSLPGADSGRIQRLGEVPIYAHDPLVRRASALQATPDAEPRGARMCEEMAAALGLTGKPSVLVEQGESQCSVPLLLDDRVPYGCVLIPAGLPETAGLGPWFGDLTVEGVSSIEAPHRPEPESSGPEQSEAPRRKRSPAAPRRKPGKGSGKARRDH